MDSIPPEQLAAMAQEDQGPLTKSIVAAFTCIALVCIVLRLFTRLRYLGRALGWEDYTIVVSMALSVATGVLQIMQANAGNGKHAVFIEFPGGVEKILVYLFWSIIFYNTSLMFTKISILLQYGRIFTVREMRIPLHIVMAICILWGIVTIITSIFTCVPVQAYWKILEQPSAKCIENKTIWYVNASINIVTDLLVAFLPVRVIWNLQIVMRQKIALLAILTIGWFVCVVSFLRLHALTILVQHPDDNTYYSAPTAYWSSIEMNLGIACASLPALKPLVVKIIPGFNSSVHTNRAYGTGTGTGTGVSSKQIGVRSTAGRIDDEYELDRTDSTAPYQTTDGDVMFGKNIYVSRQFEQHFEQSSRNSDSESQKDLVAQPKSVLQ